MSIFLNKNFLKPCLTQNFTVWQRWASRRPRPRAAALIALARSAPRRVAGCRLAAGRGAFCGQRLASRSRPVPVRATLLHRSFYFFLLLHLAASSVRRSGFDCCRCSLIVLHKFTLFTFFLVLVLVILFSLKKLG